MRLGTYHLNILNISFLKASNNFMLLIYVSYGPNVSVPINHQDDDLWGFWEVKGHEGRALTKRPYERGPEPGITELRRLRRED
jgi:hypothetical protein